MTVPHPYSRVVCLIISVKMPYSVGHATLYGNNLSLDGYCFTHDEGHAICVMRANHAADNIALMGVSSMTQRVPLVLHEMKAI